MAVALCSGNNLTDVYERTFSDVILATTGGVQTCAPAEEVRLFSQNSASLGRFGCDTDNQQLITVAGGSFVTHPDGFKIHTVLAAFRQVPVAAPGGAFSLCLTEDEASAGFLILFAQLVAASAFLQLDIGRRSAWCDYLVNFAVGNGVRADLGGACNVPASLPGGTTAVVPAPTGQCDEPCATIHNISLQSANGQPRRVPPVAVGFGDRFALNVFFEQFVGPDFCFSAVDLLATCGSFRNPCIPCTVGVTCPPCFDGIPTSGPFVLMTIGVSGYACESLCPPSGVITGSAAR